MNVEVLDFEEHPCKTKLGCLVILYEEMCISCELVYHVGTQKAWIRMPEMWKTKTFKKRYAWWPTKDNSEEFQKIVLNKLFDKYDLNLDKIAQMHRDNAAKRGTSKNV